MRSTVLLAVALAVFVLDQVTKLLIRQNLPLGFSWPPDAPVRLTFQTNTGAAFGLLQDQTVFLALVAIIVVGVILFYHRFIGQDNYLIRVSLGLQLGGALGNLVDRIRDGYVTDFIDFQFFPIFNVADTAITIGVALLAYQLLFRSPRPETPGDDGAAEPGVAESRPDGEQPATSGATLVRHEDQPAASEATPPRREQEMGSER